MTLFHIKMEMLQTVAKPLIRVSYIISILFHFTHSVHRWKAHQALMTNNVYKEAPLEWEPHMLSWIQQTDVGTKFAPQATPMKDIKFSTFQIWRCCNSTDYSFLTTNRMNPLKVDQAEGCGLKIKVDQVEECELKIKCKPCQIVLVCSGVYLL